MLLDGGSSQRRNCAKYFIEGLVTRPATHIQKTTDGYGVYLEAAYEAFGADIDDGTLVKQYGSSTETVVQYSPPKVIRCEAATIESNYGTSHPRRRLTTTAAKVNIGAGRLRSSRTEVRPLRPSRPAEMAGPEGTAGTGPSPMLAGTEPPI